MVIRDNQVGRMLVVGDCRKRSAVGVGGYHVIAPASKQSAHPLQHKRIVVNNDDALAAGYIDRCMGGGRRFAGFWPSGSATEKQHPFPNVDVRLTGWSSSRHRRSTMASPTPRPPRSRSGPPRR